MVISIEFTDPSSTELLQTGGFKILSCVKMTKYDDTNHTRNNDL